MGSPVGSDRRLEVRVEGTVPYVVRLWVDGGDPGWSCTCPASENGSFCKHCVAVAVSLNRVGQTPGDKSRSAPTGAGAATGSAAHEMGQLSEFVTRLSRGRLVEIILKQTASDAGLRQRLLAEASAGPGGAPDLAAWRRSLDSVFSPRGELVFHEETESWVAGVEEVLDGLERLLERGHLRAVIELVEYAHRLAAAADHCVDRSGGWVAGIAEWLADMHYRACLAGPPDPIQLAGRLLDLEFDSELESFFGAAVTYAELLNDAGLAEYRRLIDIRRKGGGESWYSVRSALLGWARATGDPDAIIEAYSGSRKLPDDYLEICRALEMAGRGQEAVKWAERGLRKHRPNAWLPVDDLRDYLAEALRKRGDDREALDLYWDAFAAEPSLRAYRRLLVETDRGPHAGGDWFRRCVDELRGRLPEPRPDSDTRHPEAVSPVANTLVKILFFEGHVEEAWETARGFGCQRELWLSMTREREGTHPLEAIVSYQAEVISRIDRKKNHAYQSAVNLMERIHRLSEAAGAPERFTAFVDWVRTEHWRKRNLKKLLEKKGWW